MSKDNDIISIISGKLYPDSKKERQEKQPSLDIEISKLKERIKDLERQMELVLNIILKNEDQDKTKSSRKAKLPIPTTYIGQSPKESEANSTSEFSNAEEEYEEYDSDLYEQHTEIMDK